MEKSSIVAQIDAEIEKLQKVRALLTQSGKAEVVKRLSIAEPSKRRPLSKEARARIGEAQRRRWAAQRKAEK